MSSNHASSVYLRTTTVMKTKTKEFGLDHAIEKEQKSTCKLLYTSNGNSININQDISTTG